MGVGVCGCGMNQFHFSFILIVHQCSAETLSHLVSCHGYTLVVNYDLVSPMRPNSATSVLFWVSWRRQLDKTMCVRGKDLNFKTSHSVSVFLKYLL